MPPRRRLPRKALLCRRARQSRSRTSATPNAVLVERPEHVQAEQYLPAPERSFRNQSSGKFRNTPKELSRESAFPRLSPGALEERRGATCLVDREGDVADLVVGAGSHEIGEVDLARRGAHLRSIGVDPLLYGFVGGENLRELNLRFLDAGVSLPVRRLNPGRNLGDLLRRRVYRDADLNRAIAILIHFAMKDDEHR